MRRNATIGEASTLCELSAAMTAEQVPPIESRATCNSPQARISGAGAESGSDTGSRPSEALGANQHPGRMQASRPALALPTLLRSGHQTAVAAKGVMRSPDLPREAGCSWCNRATRSGATGTACGGAGSRSTASTRTAARSQEQSRTSPLASLLVWNEGIHVAAAGDRTGSERRARSVPFRSSGGPRARVPHRCRWGSLRPAAGRLLPAVVLADGPRPS